MQQRHIPPPLLGYGLTKIAQPIQHRPRCAGLLLFFCNRRFPVTLLGTVAPELGVVAAGDGVIYRIAWQISAAFTVIVSVDHFILRSKHG
ncbi:hypothetical protein D3C73_1352860 [compost metagenome]